MIEILAIRIFVAFFVTCSIYSALSYTILIEGLKSRVYIPIAKAGFAVLTAGMVLFVLDSFVDIPDVYVVLSPAGAVITAFSFRTKITRELIAQISAIVLISVVGSVLGVQYAFPCAIYSASIVYIFSLVRARMLIRDAAIYTYLYAGSYLMTVYPLLFIVSSKVSGFSYFESLVHLTAAVLLFYSSTVLKAHVGW
ncbi:hypothetical protein Arcve_0914 [Archaeoglobus veneficus SNP6]|uniref:Uncharacterized protein n=1 Tax=Archaeoglobus veneficus (strain DSM 11195 / SNP6) TaxID=693661 RepID=F2KSF6_ARCVS|nr:hypothetical protein Arcve_0914 [Archaeoglobus veneficus SNP6]